MRLTGYVLRDLNIDAKRFPPRTVHAVISAAKNELIDFESYAANARTIYERRIAEVYREYQQRLHARQRHGLRRPAHGHRRPLPHQPRRARALPGALQHVLVDEFQDTNRAQNELVVMLAREAPQHLRRRRQRPERLPVPGRRHPQHPRVRERVPRRDADRARAELPVDADDPRRRQLGDRQQPDAQAEGAVDRAGRRRADPAVPRRGRARRGARGSATRSRGSTTRPATAGATSPSSTGPTRRAGCWRRRWCGWASPTRSSAAPASTTGARSRTCIAYLQRGGEPVRRGVAEADRQRSQARRGRHQRQPARRLGGRPRRHLPRRGASRASRPASAARRCRACTS